MELWHNRILVLDFGSQYTQLIARRIREAQVYSQILPCTASLATILAYRPQGIVLSGGPSSVYEKKAPTVAKELFDQGIPILGICYGMQVMVRSLGGRVEGAEKGEFGRCVGVDCGDAVAPHGHVGDLAADVGVTDIKTVNCRAALGHNAGGGYVELQFRQQV